MQGLRIALILLLILTCAEAAAETRVALVIGNSTYQHVQTLPNPDHDAEDMASKLRSLDFDVVVGSNLDLVGVRRAIGDFARKLDGADMALFYYAGHGLQVNGENYIAPVDAKLLSYIDLEFEAVPMNLILSAMERATPVNLVFLDACRDNPLAVNLARSMGTRSVLVGRGLAKVGSGIGSLIAFATQPGNVALDGVGRNSPFTAALLRHLGRPGRDISRELVDVRRDVLNATNGKQVPWESSSLTGEVVLKPLSKHEPVATDGTDPTNNAAELAFWETIKESTDRDMFDAYLQQYPNGLFIRLAKASIQAIEKAASERSAEDLTDSAKSELEAPIREVARSIQKELNRLGCRAGNEDGLWGAASRRALGQFAKNSKLEVAALEPSTDVLEQLQSQKVRICPLVCDEAHEERNGRCVEIKVPQKRTL